MGAPCAERPFLGVGDAALVFSLDLEVARALVFEVCFEGLRHKPANDDEAPENRIGLRTTAGCSAAMGADG